MDPIKIVVTDYIEPDLKWEEEELRKYGHVAFEYHQLKFRPESELVEKIVDADMILVNMVKMTAGVIEKLERCKLILRHGVGYDNVDVSAATKKGIRVAYEPDYCSDEVAEHAITLLLSGWRKLNVGRKILDESSRNGIWDFTEVYPVYSVKGKTVGIIGCGRIGSLTLRKLAGFEVNVLVCDPYLSEERQKELGVQVVDLETVLNEADMITVHASLDDESYHLIGERELRAMKSRAYLVNTARGGLVDADALARALREGWIAGAAVDVYEQEPPDPEMDLFKLENALLAPHLAWYSEEANWSMREKVMEDFVRFIEGRPPRFLINKELA
ncbi:MAG: C-terminal binding protein [Gemmatimonadota bacterium]|nr:C-terminal binding protein [Gemmatimonadota bacterium]